MSRDIVPNGNMRFGILCNGTVLPAWQAHCLQNLLGLDGVELAILIVEGECTSGTLSDKLSKLRPKSTTFKLYRNLFLRSRSTRLVDMTGPLSHVPCVRTDVNHQSRNAQCLSSDDSLKIRQMELDFVLKLTSESVDEEFLNTARYGVWSFWHNDMEQRSGRPPGFWEIYSGENMTEVILYRITTNPEIGTVLRRGYLGTAKHSFGKNLDAISHESSRWPTQVCVDIRHGNFGCLNAPPARIAMPSHGVPNALQLLLFTLQVSGHSLRRIFYGLFRHGRWSIGITYEPIYTYLKPHARPQAIYLKAQGKNKSLADPFGVIRDNKLTILCEEFESRSSKGVIKSMEITNEHELLKQTVALESPVHISYPYLIEHMGEIYCVPETSQAREVRLFRAEIFPTKWTPIATLIKDFPALDPTVFKYKGLWWLACTDEEEGDHSLSLWYALDLLGPWKPHTGNPVKSDIRSARPGGTPFVYEQHLYRPAQDCSRTYGGRIVLNRVIRLSPTEFEEETAAVVDPYADSNFPDGFHTISAVGNYTLIDGKCFVFDARASQRELARHFRGGIKTIKKRFNLSHPDKETIPKASIHTDLKT